MSTANAIIIGHAPRGIRQLPATVDRIHMRTPVPNWLPNEFYPTPPEAVRALLSVEEFDGTIWEPACGEGAIAMELVTAGYSVVSTDRYAYGFVSPASTFWPRRLRVPDTS